MPCRHKPSQPGYFLTFKLYYSADTRIPSPSLLTSHSLAMSRRPNGDPQPGDEVFDGRYRVLRLLGEGTFSKAWPPCFTLHFCRL